MWLSVGSSSSLIDDIGHVGMFAVYRVPTLPVAIPIYGEVRLPEWLQLAPDDEQWRGVEDRAVGTRDDADHQSQREAGNGRPARDEDRRQHQHDGEARDDRPGSGLHDAE